MENAAAEMTVLLQEQKECQGYTLKKEEWDCWIHVANSPAAGGQKVEVEYVQTFIAVS